jgi:hypothetical protein
MTNRNELIAKLLDPDRLDYSIDRYTAASMLKADEDELEQCRRVRTEYKVLGKIALDATGEIERLRAALKRAAIAGTGGAETKLVPISDADRAKLPLPTGDRDADFRNIAMALTDDMAPPTPDGYEFVEWQINVPDEVFVLFERQRAAISGPDWPIEIEMSRLAASLLTIWLPPIIPPQEQP